MGWSLLRNTDKHLQLWLPSVEFEPHAFTPRYLNFETFLFGLPKL